MSDCHYVLHIYTSSHGTWLHMAAQPNVWLKPRTPKYLTIPALPYYVPPKTGIQYLNDTYFYSRQHPNSPELGAWPMTAVSMQ